MAEEVRLALKGFKESGSVALAAGASDKVQEIIGEPAAQRAGTPIPVSAEPGTAEIDPLEISLAPLPVVAAAHSGGLTAPETKPAAPSMPFESALVESVVRRVVWGGDRRRGVARLELDGDYAGTTISVRGEDRALEVEIVLGSGSESLALPARLIERLRARGLEVASVEVR